MVYIYLDEKNHVSIVISQTMAYELKVEEKGFWIFNMENSKPKNSCIYFDISQTMVYEHKVEEKGFWICNMENSKTSPKYHFGVTKKDPDLVFHFHVLNLFKCWSNLDLTDI